MVPTLRQLRLLLRSMHKHIFYNGQDSGALHLGFSTSGKGEVLAVVSIVENMFKHAS
jgi:hypothetical protein